MNLRELQKRFLERVEAASGKPVILQSDSTFHGHATIKLAAKDQPAHLLLYKPEQESVLLYLVAYQCEFALRTIRSNPSAQFDLVAKGNMLPDVLDFMLRHHQGKNDIPASAVPQLAKRFGDGLGFQLRSMPITLRIDKQIHDAQVCDQHSGAQRMKTETEQYVSTRRNPFLAFVDGAMAAIPRSLCSH